MKFLHYNKSYSFLTIVFIYKALQKLSTFNIRLIRNFNNSHYWYDFFVNCPNLTLFIYDSI